MIETKGVAIPAIRGKDGWFDCNFKDEESNVRITCRMRGPT